MSAEERMRELEKKELARIAEGERPVIKKLAEQDSNLAEKFVGSKA